MPTVLQGLKPRVTPSNFTKSTTRWSTYLDPARVTSNKTSHIPSSGPSYHPIGSPSVTMSVRPSIFPSITPTSFPSDVQIEKLMMLVL